MRLVRGALTWIGGVFLVWATLRAWMIGGSFVGYYGVAFVFLLVALVVEPFVTRLGRRREPF